MEHSASYSLSERDYLHITNRISTFLYAVPIYVLKFHSDITN